MSDEPIHEEKKSPFLQGDQFVTKYCDTRSRKKKTFQKLVLAHSDILAAYKTCELFIEKIEMSEQSLAKQAAGMNNPLYFPLLEAFIISYARPFTDNDGLGVLPKKWSNFEIPEFAEAHKLILQYRNELVAHTDHKVRKIQIVPPDSDYVPTPDDMKAIGPGFAVHTYGIALQQIGVFSHLSAFQGKRLLAEVQKLLSELYDGMDLPNKHFELRIDEGL